MKDIGSEVVMARAMAPGPFRLEPGSTLGGGEIHPEVTAPRATAPNGTPHADLFAFSLKRRSDLARFAVGQFVDLLGTDAA